MAKANYNPGPASRCRAIPLCGGKEFRKSLQTFHSSSCYNGGWYWYYILPPTIIFFSNTMHWYTIDITFFLDIILNQDFVHTSGQQMLLIWTKMFYILRNLSENNLQFVIVNWVTEHNLMVLLKSFAPHTR